MPEGERAAWGGNIDRDSSALNQSEGPAVSAVFYFVAVRGESPSYLLSVF